MDILRAELDDLHHEKTPTQRKWKEKTEQSTSDLQCVDNMQSIRDTGTPAVAAQTSDTDAQTRDPDASDAQAPPQKKIRWFVEVTISDSE